MNEIEAFRDNLKMQKKRLDKFGGNDPFVEQTLDQLPSVRKLVAQPAGRGALVNWRKDREVQRQKEIDDEKRKFEELFGKKGKQQPQRSEERTQPKPEAKNNRQRSARDKFDEDVDAIHDEINGTFGKNVRSSTEDGYVKVVREVPGREPVTITYMSQQDRVAEETRKINAREAITSNDYNNLYQTYSEAYQRWSDQGWPGSSWSDFLDGPVARVMEACKHRKITEAQRDAIIPDYIKDKYWSKDHHDPGAHYNGGEQVYDLYTQSRRGIRRW
jgi:hypothetical protein